MLLSGHAAAGDVFVVGRPFDNRPCLGSLSSPPPCVNPLLVCSFTSGRVLSEWNGFGAVSGNPPEFHHGKRVRLPGETSIVTVESLRRVGDETVLIVADAAGGMHKKTLSAADLGRVLPAAEDGAASPEEGLAGLWAERMAASVRSATSTVLASSRLRPYPHQMSAVYGRMPPQTLAT